MTTYQIGTSIGTLTDLSGLTPPVKSPLQSFKPYAKVFSNGSGGAVGLGWATDEWSWNIITDAQRGALRAFCTGASSTVYIKTYNDSLTTPAWKIYRAKMIWSPEAEDRQSSRRLKFQILFRLMEDVTP